MLNQSKIEALTQGMYKAAQVTTLGDLVNAIHRDRGLTETEKSLLLSQVKAQAGFASNSTPLRSLAGIGGGILGYLVSKYFGANALTRGISAIGGALLGNTLFGNKQDTDGYIGYKRVW